MDASEFRTTLLQLNALRYATFYYSLSGLSEHQTALGQSWIIDGC